ncbi:MAG: preprotein translocase subunit YajC [Clostridia bacterium]|nr:preprotein translocase subunit YajC [Clostridia bacterium]
MIWNLLADEPSAGNNYGSLIMIVVMSALLIVFMIINRRSQKKRQEETQNMLDAIQPGNKVKTIGGICGTVVEVCKEDNTFVLETGSDKSGKSYIRFDKQAVYQSDVTVDKNEEKKEDKEEDKNDQE